MRRFIKQFSSRLLVSLCAGALGLGTTVLPAVLAIPCFEQSNQQACTDPDCKCWKQNVIGCAESFWPSFYRCTTPDNKFDRMAVTGYNWMNGPTDAQCGDTLYMSMADFPCSWSGTDCLCPTAPDASDSRWQNGEFACVATTKVECGS